MKTFGTLEHVPREEGLYRSSWLVKAEPHVTIRLKRTFPRMKQRHGDCFLMDTPETCRELVWFMVRYPLAVSAEHRALLESGEREHIARESLVASITTGEHPSPEIKLAVPLRKYQETAAHLAYEGKSLLLADDVGLGKTASAIGLLGFPETRPALIVALAHLPKQIEREVNRFAPELRTHIIRSGTPYELRGLRRLRGGGSTSSFPDVIISSYMKLHGWRDVLASSGIKTVIFDEVQELRHSGTKKGDAAEHVAGAARFRIGLSATPIHNLGSELYNIYNVLAPDKLGTREEFIREWCTAEDSRGRASLHDPAAFGTYLRTQGLMLRRTRSEVGRELPPVTKVVEYIDWDSGELEKIERPAAELARIILSRESANLARLQASEELSMMVRQATGIAKALPVADFVRLLVESGERVLLYGWHRTVYDLWLDRLGDLAPALYTGSESARQKDKSAERFKSGETPVLIMSLRSGVGIDGLQTCCRTVVYGEIDWSPAVHEQDTGRVYRDGQTDPVFAYYLLADGGSDPVVADALSLKRDQLDGVRDPAGALLERLDTGGGHARRLAELYLRKGDAA